MILVVYVKLLGVFVLGVERLDVYLGFDDG